HDCIGGSFWIAGLQYWATDHQIIGAGFYRSCWSHDPFLVTTGTAGGPDAGSHQDHAAADNVAQLCSLFRGTNESIETDIARLLCAGGSELFHVQLISGSSKIRIVIRGQNRYSEQAQLRSVPALDGRFHGLRIRVHGQEGCTQLCDAFDTPGHRIANVMQLEVEKNLLTGRNQLGCEREAAGEGELIADLVKPGRLAEPRHQGVRRRRGRYVEGHDQAFAGVQRHGHGSFAISRAISTRRSSCARSKLAMPMSAMLSISSKAVSARWIATCSGITSAPQPSSRICRSAMSDRSPPALPGEADAIANARPLKAA